MSTDPLHDCDGEARWTETRVCACTECHPDGPIVVPAPTLAEWVESRRGWMEYATRLYDAYAAHMASCPSKTGRAADIDVTVEDEEDKTIQAKFEKYHRENPHVYELLEEAAFRLIEEQGKRRIGMKALVEDIRWNHRVRTTGPEFLIDNKFTSRYARLLVKNHPEWESRIEMRRLRSR